MSCAVSSEIEQRIQRIPFGNGGGRVRAVGSSSRNLTLVERSIKFCEEF